MVAADNFTATATTVAASTKENMDIANRDIASYLANC